MKPAFDWHRAPFDRPKTHISDVLVMLLTFAVLFGVACLFWWQAGNALLDHQESLNSYQVRDQ